MLKRILFVTVGSKENPGLYARCIPPLVRECQKRNIQYFCISFYPDTQKYLQDNGVEAIYPLSKIDRLFFEIYKFYAKTFSLFVLIATLGQAHKKRRRIGLHMKFITFVKQAYFLTIFRTFNPQIVFVSPDQYFQRIIEISKTYHVPTVSALTCLVNKEEHGKISSDKLLLPGISFQTIYKDKAKTSTIGMLHLDSLTKNYPTKEKGYTVFLTENVNVETTKKHLREILHSSKLPIIVKLHPADKHKDYEEFNNGGKSKVIGNCDLYKLMANSNLVIGQNTTALIEALALHKPILSMDSNSCYNQCEDFVQNYLYSLDGKTSERALNIMEQMIREEG